jgi:alpha,alpha-trehalose phosphorylase
MTVHESSLSAGVHAVIAARTGHMDQAWQLMLRTVRLDLDDVNRDTCDGLHITAMSGGWLAVVKGFAGMKTSSGTLSFAPALPKQLTKYQFAVQYRARVIRVCVDTSGVALTLLQGEAISLSLYEQEHRLENNLHVPLQTKAHHRRTRALIFDLDGVLTDTARLHYEAWKKLAKETWNFSFTEEMNEQFKGVERRACMRILAKLMGITMTEDQIIAYADQKNAYYRTLLEDLTPASLMPQARNILSACREQGYRTAVASASRNTRDILRRTGIYDLFDTIVDGNDVQRPKPDPACFLEAAARLGLTPQECMILEDSSPAITAAVEAGFPCVGVGEQSLEHMIFHLKRVADLDFSRIP